MTFDEALTWLYSTQHFGIKLGLDNIRSLLFLLGAPEKRLKFLHVAGTNGKGSVCAFLDAILQAQGYRSSLFTSPHLVEFQERIRVQGHPISREEIATGVALLKKVARQLTVMPTFFEFTTALALWHFSRQDVEFIVWETGMGGCWDATNVVTPLVSVITPISFDHKEWLGDTLAKIASEKAGIFKPGVPAISAPQPIEVAEELYRKADQKSVPLYFVKNAWTASEIGLYGTHQHWNASLAVEALNTSGIPVSRKAICQGLAKVQWPGRFQRLSERLVVDGAHNPASAQTLVATWKEVFGNRKARVVFGSLKDKENGEFLLILSHIVKEFFFVPVENMRSRPAAEHHAPNGIPSRCFENSTKALNAALADEGPVLVTGSLFLVGEVLAQENGIPYRPTSQ